MRARRAQIAVAIIALVGFLVVVQQVLANGPLVDLDRQLVDHYGHHRFGRVRSTSVAVGSGTTQTLARAVAPLGEAVLLLGAVGALACLLYRRGRRAEANYLAIASIGGVVIDLIVRVAFGHVRPATPFPYHLLGRFGLPSGHALDATVCFGAMLVVTWPRLTRFGKLVGLGATAVVVAAVSYSRVVTLTHPLSDVVAGDTLGLAWLLVVTVAFSLPRRDRLPSTA